MKKYIASHNLELYVRFTGWLSREELAALYRTSHAYVTSSVLEGMSISMLEALSSGLYVITTKVSGAEELITPGVNGEFVEMRNPGQLADAIRRFSEKPKIVPADFLESFRKKYDWSAIVRQYNDIIISLKFHT
jgi:glycosyltransferase involved in cell wall biosynthesis